MGFTILWWQGNDAWARATNNSFLYPPTSANGTEESPTHKSERLLPVYCVEKVSFSAAVCGWWKINLSDRFRIDDRESRRR